MTALGGIVSFGGALGSGSNCDRILAAQRVYGPDGAAGWSDGSVAMGRSLHRLLPEDVFDRGPVVRDGGRRVLVADVRLDDRPALERTLGIAATEARLLSDAEILMRALDRWQEQALDHLVGDFAFAFWDGDRQRLMLARDCVGQRPLHYHRGRDFFAFASMPKGLHALSDVPRAADEQAAADFLALIPETGARSFFRGVDKVQPGHYLIVERGKVVEQRYWHPRPRPLGLKTADDYAEALREQLDVAVASRLRGADGNVAAQLSAGFDSSAVAATAARLLGPDGGTVTAFTSVPRTGFAGHDFRDSMSDEGPLAAAVAAMYPNMEHVLVRESGSPLDNLDRNFFLNERPMLNICNGVWVSAINAAAKQRGLSVMLGAPAGNMTFSYNGMQLLSQLVKQGRFTALAREIFHLRRNGARWGTVAAQTVGPFLPRPVWRFVNRVRGKAVGIDESSAINPRHAEEMNVLGRAIERGLNLEYQPRADSVETRLWVLGRVDPGNYNKGTLGGWGIDYRDPSADRRVIEFCLSIPAEQYLTNGVQRALARRAFADRLPAALLNERRKGYQAADWYESLGAARAQVLEEIGRLSGVPSAAAALDIQRLSRLMEDWPTEGWETDKTIGSYRLALLRGISAGHFLRKASGSNQ